MTFKLLVAAVLAASDAADSTAAARWPAGPCRQSLRDSCGTADNPAKCELCVGTYQHQLRVAGCAPDAVSSFCAAAGTAQVCFDDGVCVSLDRAASTPAQRAAINATCDPSAPSAFKWGPPDVICQWTGVHPFDWAVYVASDPRDAAAWAALEAKAELGSTYWADLQAIMMQGSWYMDNEKGVPAMLAAGTALPANYRLPMILVSSGFNRLRDLDDASLQLLYSLIDNAGPEAINIPADADVAPGGSFIAFSGVDGQSGGKDHPALPHCRPGSSPSGFPLTNFDYASFSLRLDHALTYAGVCSQAMLRTHRRVIDPF